MSRDDSDAPHLRADISLAKLDAITDQWHEECSITAMIKNACSPMNLTKNAPPEIRAKFKARMEAQIDAIVRQAFLEGMVRAIDGDVR